MKAILALLALISIILTGCSPAVTPAAQTSLTPPSGQPATIAPVPTLTEPAQATATNKPGGKNPRPAPTSTTPTFIASEILGRPTDRSVTANVVPATALEIYYEYSTAPDAYTAQTSRQTAVAGVPLETPIEGLQADTRYYYRVRYRQPGAEDFAAGQEHTFVTQRAAGSAFTFDIQADSHPERLNKMFDPELYRRTLLNAAADRPDFYLSLGDDFSVDNLKMVSADTVTQLYINQRQYLGLVGGSAPAFLVNGNHEQAALVNLDGTAENVAVWAQTARNAYFPQPAPDAFYMGDSQTVEYIDLLRDYYAWTWGDALFVVIDPYWHSSVAVDNAFRGSGKTRDLWNVTLGDEQYQWLKQTLEESTARWKFVFAHHVDGTGRGGIELAGLYEWGGNGPNGDYLFDEKRPGWNEPIQQLLADNHVTIFFQGHDHIFCRQELDGVVYQTLPVPADPNYTLYNADAYRSGDKLPGSGHLRVTVAPQGVTVDYVRAFLPKDETDGHHNGEVAYSYTVGQLAGSALPAPTSGPAAAGSRLGARSGTPGQTLTLTAPVHAVDVILGRPTDQSITVSVLGYQDGEGLIAFGAQRGAYLNQTPSFQMPAGRPVEVFIDSLEANTQYYYQLSYREGGADEFAAMEEGMFHTQRDPGSPLVFTVQADSHLDSNSSLAVYAQTLANVVADRPDFHIDLGDTFMTDKYSAYTDAEEQYLAQRYYLGLVGRSAPLFLALGNHDGETGGNRGRADAMATWSAQMRTGYFPNPVPDDFYTGNATPHDLVGPLQDYYAWEWGDALFVILDPYWFTSAQGGQTDNWNRTLGSEQYEWLVATLKSSQAAAKFVFIHQLVGGIDSAGRGGAAAAGLYEWGGCNADDSYGFDAQRPGWEKPIHQLLVDNQVTAVFHGHDHLFALEKLDGILYVEVPQPSAARYDATGSAQEYGYTQGDVLGSPGHVRVTVSPASGQVTIGYVRAYLPQHETGDRQNGQTTYSYTLKIGYK